MPDISVYYLFTFGKLFEVSKFPVDVVWIFLKLFFIVRSSLFFIILTTEKRH